MSVLSFPATGRTLTVINRTGGVIGAAGTTIGPYGTKVVSLRKIYGHPSYHSELQSLVSLGKIQVQLSLDILDVNDLDKLDAPLSGDIWLTRQIFTDPVASDVDAFKTSFTAPAADTTYSGSDLDGATGQGEVDYARNFTVTGTTGVGEALESKVITVNGTDMDDQALQEQITTTVLGASASATDEGKHAFKTITSVAVPADASGSPGAYEFGFGEVFGLSRPLTQGGLIKEFTDNAVPGVAATVVLSPTALPNGSVDFDTSPNGVHDYVVYFIAG